MLYKSINTTFRYDIRKAEKENLEHRILSSPSMDEFRDFIFSYAFFASSKGIPPLKFEQLEYLFRLNCTMLTKVLQNNIEIATHFYIFDDKRVRLLYSYHNIEFLDDTLRSYANKFLHWEDILFFKSKNFLFYDFGGINMDNHPGISKFKLAFGGILVDNYSYERALPGVRSIARLRNLFR